MTQLHTSRWVYGFDHNVLFNSGRVVCGMHKHNNPAETAVVVYGPDQQRGQGEGKGAEEQDRESLSLTIGSYGRGWCQERACVFAFGYGAVEESGGQNRTLSCSVRLTLTAAEKQRLHRDKKQAGEESWLK